MRKLVLGIVALFLLAGISYGFLWYHQAGKIRLIAQRLSDFSSAAMKGSDFSYSDVEVSGFPLKFMVEIRNPTFSGRYKYVPVELSSDDPILVESDIVGSHFDFSFPKNIKVIYGEGDKKLNLTTIYNENPKLVLEFKSGLVASAISPVGDAKYNIKSLQYKDSGYISNDAGSGKQIISSGATFVNLQTKEEGNKTNTSLQMGVSDFNGDEFLEPEGLQYKLGVINVSADLSVSGPVDVKKLDSSDININVTDFKVESDLFSFGLRGNLNFIKDDVFPVGVLQLDVGNYENFVDYQSAIINLRMENSLFPIFKVDDRQRGAFKEFLRRIASSGVKSDLSFDIKRLKGESIFAGDRSFSELANVFKEIYSGVGEESPAVADEGAIEKIQEIEPIKQEEKSPSASTAN